MNGDFLLGSRVRLSPLGIEKRIVTRGATVGTVKGVKVNAEPTLLYVHRDGLKNPAWYAAEFWELL
jgi:hypothetical protein